MERNLRHCSTGISSDKPCAAPAPGSDPSPLPPPNVPSTCPIAYPYSLETILANAEYRTLVDNSFTDLPNIHPLQLFDSDGHHGVHLTRSRLENTLAMVEEGAEVAFAFSDSSHLFASLFSSFPKSHVLFPSSLFTGIASVLPSAATQYGITYERVDVTNPAAVKECIERFKSNSANENRSLIFWMDCPSQPKVKVVDVTKLSTLAHTIIGNNRAFVVVDSTMATPALLNPLILGADACVHMSMHQLACQADAPGAVLALSSLPLAQNVAHYIRSYHENHEEDGLSPFDSWIVLRGLQTLNVRMRAQSATALAVAEYLQGHKAVKKVYYPGLVSYSQNKLANDLFHGRFGPSLSFQLKADESKQAELATMVVNRTTLFRKGCKSGGISGIEHCAAVDGPASTTLPNLIRLTIGLEDLGDIITDLDIALQTVLAKK
eukprot:gene11272-12571_t